MWDRNEIERERKPPRRGQGGLRAKLIVTRQNFDAPKVEMKNNGCYNAALSRQTQQILKLNDHKGQEQGQCHWHDVTRQTQGVMRYHSKTLECLTV